MKRYRHDRPVRQPSSAFAGFTLNRPERLNAIGAHMPREIHSAVELANDDPGVHVIVLRGEGRSFCSGYDLKAYAETGVGTQGAEWDPIKDYRFMKPRSWTTAS